MAVAAANSAARLELALGARRRSPLFSPCFLRAAASGSTPAPHHRKSRRPMARRPAPDSPEPSPSRRNISPLLPVRNSSSPRATPEAPQTEWMVNGAVGGNATTGTVDSSGNYTAPASISQSENVTVTVALTASAQQNFATAAVSIILPGQANCPPVHRQPAGRAVLHLSAGTRKGVG